MQMRRYATTHDMRGETDAASTRAEQLELFTVTGPPKLGPRGFPMCASCDTREGIGPSTALCTACWSPERDPIGAASWEDIQAAIATAYPRMPRNQRLAGI